MVLPIVVLLIIVALPMCWGFSTVASVIKAKESGEDDNWKRHSSVGSKGVRFFLTYVLVVLVLLLSIILLSSVGLIPFIGLLLVFILESHLLGRESIVAYSDCLNDAEEASELRKKWSWLPVRIGWLPAVLTFIPFVGWLFLPLSIFYEVVGFAFLAEQSRRS